MSELLSKIRSRGYWSVIIRPNTFQEKRASEITALYPILQKTSVQFRGWDFPNLGIRSPLHVDVDWVGQELDYGDIHEIWRFYQSGQFIHISSLPIDWRDQSSWWPADKDWKAGAFLGTGDVVFRFTEIFEFAARLALTEAGDEQMHIEIKLSGIKNRSLWADNPSRMPFFRKYTSMIEEFPYKVDMKRKDLIANPREHALKPAQELFRRFNWDQSLDFLKGLQLELKN